MNTVTKVILGVVVLGLVGTGGFVATRKKPTPVEPDSQSSQSSNSSADIKSQEASSKPVTDACATFSASELSSTLDASFAEGTKASTNSTSSDGLKSAQCQWLQTDEATVGIANAFNVTLVVENYSNKDNAQTKHTSTNVTTNSLGYETVDGVGDMAAFKRLSTVDKQQAQLEWTNGSSLYRLSVVKNKGLEQKTIEQKIKTLAGTKF